MHRTIPALSAVVVALAMLITACSGGNATSSAPAASGTAQPTGPPVEIKWYCCLGTGDDKTQLPVEAKVVDDFNKSQTHIKLVFDHVAYAGARAAFATRIASGTPPDVVGPVGVGGAEAFRGQWLDLKDLIAKNNVDLSVYGQGAVDFYKVAGQGQIGIPFAVFPSFIYFNKDLFDEAGLPYPPQRFGDTYQGKEWNWDTLRDLAKQLTVDDKGNDATSQDFRPDSIVQFGFDLQYGTDPRAMATPFGANRLIDGAGRAQIPSNWLSAWNFFYDGMFRDHWMPNDPYRNSDVFGKGSVFNSGHLAMAYTHLWYTCCIDPVSKGGKVKNWDIAVVPSYQGVTTAKLHADTFVIMKATRHPDEAFQVYRYLITNKDLLDVYGAMPAIGEMQAGFFRGMDDKFAPVKVNWQVAVDSLAYPDVPNHEEGLPNFLKARQATTDFQTLIDTTPGLDINTEAQKLQSTLQAIYDEVH